MTNVKNCLHKTKSHNRFTQLHKNWELKRPPRKHAWSTYEPPYQSGWFH